jgi:putative transposase
VGGVGPSGGMPRKLREQVAGGVYHVYARGNRKALIYLDDLDRKAYLSLLGRVVTRQRWRCLAYCLMPNHVHLLVELAEADLAAGMRRLHGDYAQQFNARHGHTGHVFQGRYGSVPLTDDAQMVMAAGYVAANPVAAGLCARPEAWRWSSHAATADPRVPRPGWLDVERLLEYLSAWGGDPRATYVDLVERRLVAPAAAAA